MHPAGTSDLPCVATVFDAVRRPMAQHVATVSREAGLLFTLNYPGLELDFPHRQRTPRGRAARRHEEESVARSEEADTLQQIYARVRANWEWAWETRPDSDLRRALEMLAQHAA
jgi:salicylate hydroxylase